MNVPQRIVVLICGIVFFVAALVPPWRANIGRGITELAGIGPVWIGPSWCVTTANADLATVDWARLSAILTAIVGMTVALVIVVATRKKP